MKTLTQEQRYYTASCGLPAKFLLQKIVLNYAEGYFSQAEYDDFYNRMTVTQKKTADDLIVKIHDAQSEEDPKFPQRGVK